jgi:hypothetical protein
MQLPLHTTPRVLDACSWQRVLVQQKYSGMLHVCMSAWQGRQATATCQELYPIPIKARAHVATGNGILEMGEDPNVLGISDGICSTSPAYLENNCTCAVGLTTFETCTHPVEFCK